MLFAEAYFNSKGEEELKYAYADRVVGPSKGEDIERRISVSQTEVLDVTFNGNKITEKLKTTFYSKPQFYNDGVEWRQIEYATTTPEIFTASGAIKYVQRREWWEKLLPGKPVFAQTSTFYPNASVESTSVDGFVQNVNTDIFFNCTDFGTVSAFDASTVLQTGVSNSYIDNFPPGPGFEDQYECNLRRSFLLFDTSSLPDNATVSSASISIYVTSRATQNSDTVAFTDSSPASNTAITTSDYNAWGSQITGTTGIGSLSTSAYNSFSINSGSLSVVSLTSVTKTAFLLKSDIDFFLNPSENTGDFVNFSSAEVSGTSQDPKLDVTYTASSFSFGQWFPF